MHLLFGAHFRLTVNLPQRLAILGANSRHFYSLRRTNLSSHRHQATPIHLRHTALYRFLNVLFCIALYTICWKLWHSCLYAWHHAGFQKLFIHEAVRHTSQKYFFFAVTLKAVLSALICWSASVFRYRQATKSWHSCSLVRLRWSRFLPLEYSVEYNIE